MIGRMYLPSFKRVETAVAAWTAPCHLFWKVCASMVQMLPAQLSLLPLATRYTGCAMVLVMLNKVILSLESFHWGASTTLPLFCPLTVFFLVPGPDPFVREGNVAGNANFL